jgi:phage minor structural protein, N-terminal domain protein|nr:MAG TPA: tail protein [Caudoviricetes sp.]
MRPILYNANETAFETYGLGEIDATKAQVTRERNGNYTLYIEYPASGPLAGTFKNDMRIKSDAGLRTKNQTFFISRIVKDSTGILKVYAKHISHLTETMAIRNNTNATGTAQAALAIWALNALGGIRFDTWSDIDLTSKTSWNIADFKTARDVLGGVKGSILDVWGGEYEFDNTVIRLHKQLGRKSPTVLEYGRNILRAEDDQDIEGAYTSVYPYATYTPENQGTGEGEATSQQVTVELPEKYVDGPYIGLYNERRVLIVDFSSNFKDKEVPTIDKLRRLAKEYAINNRLGLPKINTKIEYVDLSKTLDYKLTQILEEAELCDIVPVYYPQIGLTSEDAKLTTIVYDVLLEQNDSVEVGVIGDGFKSSMTSNLSGKIDDLANNQQRLVNTLPDYLLNAQGNKVWYNRPDNKEHKVGDIWFEKNGLYDRMYVWNGSQWEKRIDTEDVDKVKKEVDKQISDAQASTTQAIAQADAKAEEALKKAGTLPDTSKLSDQIKQQILSSPDLQNKVTEGINSVDGDTIYSKVFSKLTQQFVPKTEFEDIDRMQSEQGRDLIALSKKIATQTLEFNKLTESNKLYERILGTSETDAPDKLSRLVMSSDIFQTEVGKYVTDDNNLIVNSMTMSTNTLVGNNNPNASVSVADGIFTIKAQGLTGYNWSGFTLPIYVKKIYHGETYTLGFKYRIKEYPDVSFAFNIKNHGLNKTLTWSNIGENRPPLDEWQEFQKTFTMQEDFLFGEDKNYPFYIFLSKNGWIEFKEPILVRGSSTGPYKPSQFDDAFAETRSLESQLTSKIGEVSDKTAEARQLAIGAQDRADQASARSQYASEKAEDAQAKAIQVAEQARQAQQTAEATRTQVTQLAGSWSVRNLNSAGDVLGAINLNPDGSVRINEGLLSVGEKTIIKDGVIKKSMIGNAQIGTAHISEIDASKANLINVSAKNIVADGLTANIIKGGRLSSLNGITDFDLQTGWIDINNANVGIRNQFRNKPLQYLIFGEGAINGKDASYTALMSNSWKRVAMDDGSAGIQIWNANDNTTAINIYGDVIEFMYNANDKKSVGIDTVTNKLFNIEDIVIRGYSLSHILDDIFDNFNNLNHDGNYTRGYHGQWRG